MFCLDRISFRISKVNLISNLCLRWMWGVLHSADTAQRISRKLCSRCMRVLSRRLSYWMTNKVQMACLLHQNGFLPRSEGVRVVIGLKSFACAEEHGEHFPPRPLHRPVMEHEQEFEKKRLPGFRGNKM